MQCTRLETFRQSRVVIIVGAVVVVVAVAVTYSPVTANCARRLRGSTQGDDVGPMNIFVVHSGSTSRCSRHRVCESPPVSGDAPPQTAVILPLTKVPLLLRVDFPLAMGLQAKVQRAGASLS